MVPYKFNHIAHCWSNLLAEELSRLGCQHVCIAPGSRSTPLVLAFSQHNNFNCVTHFDERSLGFYALGYAQAKKEPVVIITTSGTAVANLLPAVVEARLSHTPLLILSADRDYSEHYHGANQTIDQHHIFGKYVHMFQNFPAPTTEISPQWLLSSIDEAYHQMTKPNQGPVHLNIMFHEQFFAKTQNFQSYLSSIDYWLYQVQPYKTIPKHTQTLCESKSPIKSLNNTIALVAEISNESDALLIADFCQENQIIMLTECHSKLFGYKGSQHLIDLSIDQILKSNIEVDTILYFGEKIISKKAIELIKKCKHKIHISDQQDANDSSLAATLSLKATYESSLAYLKQCSFTYSATWKDELNALFDHVNQILISKKEMELSEISILNELFLQLPEQSLCFVSNSLPIRMLNSFTQSKKQHIVYANRGASGIDGNISTAIGIAAAKNQELYFITGDLTFLYDLTALSMISKYNVTIKCCLLNNNGGQIFSFLPIKDHFNAVDTYFTTPHHLTMKQSAAQFNIDYYSNSKSDSSLLPANIESVIKHQNSLIYEFIFNSKHTKQQIKQLHSSI